jgi:ABC-2 type transport system permease protein
MYSRGAVIGFICAAIVVLAMYSLYLKEYEPQFFNSSKMGNWRNYIEQEANYTISLLNDQSIGMTENVRIQYINESKVYDYLLRHNIPPIAEDTAASMVLKANNLFIYIIVCIIMISCFFITSEYSNKTLGRLVMSGASRWKILTSKYLAILFFAIVFMLIFAVFTVLCSWIVFGFDDFSTHYVYFDGVKVVERNVMVQMMLNFLYNTVSLVSISSLAVFVAVLTKSNLIGMSLCFAVSVFGSLFSSVFAGTDWLKYTLFANTDFSRFLNNEVAFDNYTPAMSLGVLGIHTIIFVVGAYTVFCKQDVVI